MSIQERRISTNGLIPHDVLKIIYTDTFLSRLPTIEMVSSVIGGVAHRVYCISSAQERYYLKIRGDRFVQIPSIICNPADIGMECTALLQFHQIAPENFPKVMSFNSEQFYMVLTDAIPNGDKLESMFLTNKVSSQMIFNLADTLRTIHDRAKSYDQGIRSDDDAAKYEELFQHRFGYRHNLVLDELVAHLRRVGNRHLIRRCFS